MLLAALAAWHKALTLVPAYPLSTNDFKSEVIRPVEGVFTGRSLSQMLDDIYSNSGLGENEPQPSPPLILHAVYRLTIRPLTRNQSGLHIILLRPLMKVRKSAVYGLSGPVLPLRSSTKLPSGTYPGVIQNDGVEGILRNTGLLLYTIAVG